MQEIVVNTWCDHLAAHEGNVPGSAVAVSLPGHPGRELDLCEACRHDLLGELTALVADRSRPAGPVAASPSKGPSKRPRSAPAAVIAGGMVEVLDGQQALTFNGADVGPDTDPRVRTCPLDGTVSKSYRALEQHARTHHGDYRLPRLFGTTCPMCAGDFEVLGSHAVSAHGSGVLTALFVLAREAGDPHGVVAAREAEWVDLRRALGIGAAA